ncbi:MAG: GMC family oxidoreductase [Alphaproteobacteria bacterium]
MGSDTPELDAALAGASLDVVGQAGRHDAIVVGAGAAGGFAAELLTEAGLRVLVLDAGWREGFWERPIRRSVSTMLENLSSPNITRRLPPSVLWKVQRIARIAGRLRQPIQSECYAWPSAPESFVDDLECPYETPSGKPFNWIRVRGLGGRMTVPLHGRQYYRHVRRDFRPADGASPPWPFEPEDIDPWYDMVEQRLDLSGRHEGHSWAPDSHISRLRTPTPLEDAFLARIKARYPAVTPILGRYAPPMPSMRRAAATGRLLCRTGAIARHIEMDGARATGVVFYDRRARTLVKASAPLIFLCAATLETTRILLTSRSDAHPEGLGGRSGALGRNLMDHVSIKIEGEAPSEGLDPGPAEQGPCVYLPRFDARETGKLGPERGFGVRVYLGAGTSGGTSYFVAVADSEMLPRAENRVTLSSRTDAWGIPILHISCSHGETERSVARQQAAALRELADLAGAKLLAPIGDPAAPGSAIHEVGTARMGDDPNNSVLDPYNECWDARGLFVTDGSSFPSEGIQNPTLTILALTARACRRAIETR